MYVNGVHAGTRLRALNGIKGYKVPSGGLGPSPRKLLRLAILNLEDGRSLHKIMQT